MAPSTVVLVVASGAPWEPEALRLLGERPGLVVLKRCVDVADLMATAASGQAQVAVVGLDAPGLDATAVDHLRRHGVRPVAVVAAEQHEAGRVRAARLGVATLVADSSLADLPDAVASAEAAQPQPALPDLDAPDPAPTDDPPAEGRVLVVWGPTGAPGRSTLAAAVAGELGRRRRRTILVDADPYGGSIAQQLGIMDEVSGLLAATRLAASGQLEERFASVQRGLDAHLSVVSGLPRAERWAEVRGGTVEQVLDVARAQADVVVDTGFCLEDDPARDVGTRPARNGLTLGALDVADVVLVVGSADPVGLARLARGLVELREITAAPLHVVVNRMRPSLGWAEKEIAAMVGGFARLAGLHFLPDDRAAVDRSLVTGRMLLETGDSALSRAVADLVDVVVPASSARPTKGSSRGTGRVRPRTAGTARRR